LAGDRGGMGTTGCTSTLTEAVTYSMTVKHY
jgi:hypothetical protein